MSYKKLVEAIANMKTEEDRLEVWGQINRSFEKEKITWKDHETLYDLASRITL